MKSNQSQREAGTAPADAERSHILMVTVDSLPEPYRILGLVEATVTVPPNVASTGPALDLLEDQAVALGADGVIGIRVSQVVLPGTSQARFVGRITDHYASAILATALGTAVRRLPATDRGAAHRHQGWCSRGAR